MRLFVPSWQRPGSWAENLEALEAEAWVEGVELLFFDWDSGTRRLFEAEAPRIEAFAGRFAFSLHLPDPLGPEAAGLVEASSSYVERYVLHPGRGEAWAGAFLACAAAGAEGSAGGPDAGAGRFALEYTGSPAFDACAAAFPELGLCADTGSLLRSGLDPAAWATRRAPRIAELHLHAARPEGGAAPRGLLPGGSLKDHLALRGDEPWLETLAAQAEAGNWIVVLETFDLTTTRASFEALRRLS